MITDPIQSTSCHILGLEAEPYRLEHSASEKAGSVTPVAESAFMQRLAACGFRQFCHAPVAHSAKQKETPPEQG